MTTMGSTGNWIFWQDESMIPHFSGEPDTPNTTTLRQIVATAGSHPGGGIVALEHGGNQEIGSVLISGILKAYTKSRY
jgi:hypothetical protein